jgi:GntR family transcriptional regulator
LLRAVFSRDYFTEKSLLQVDGQEKILVIERIRFANKTPIALERSFWPESIGKILMKEDLESAKFYEILEKNNIEIKMAKEKISAVNAEIEEADLLGIRGGEALIKMERLSFGGDNKPIEFTATKYCSDKYHYNIELAR